MNAAWDLYIIVRNKDSHNEYKTIYDGRADGCIFEVWEWINKFFPHFTIDGIPYAYTGIKVNLC